MEAWKGREKVRKKKKEREGKEETMANSEEQEERTEKMGEKNYYMGQCGQGRCMVMMHDDV